MKTYLLTLFICLSVVAPPLFSDESPASKETEEPPRQEEQEIRDYSPLPTTAYSQERSYDLSAPLTVDPFEAPPEEIYKEPDNFQTKFLNMLFVLGLLIGFMIIASWMLKRMMRTRVDQLNNSSSIRIVETRPLSPRSTIFLLNIMGQGIVIAETHAGVSYLATVALGEEEKSFPSIKEIN